MKTKLVGCLLISCLSFFLINCSGPKAIECAPVEIRTETVYQDKIVPVPARLTPEIEIPFVADEDKDTYGLSAGYKARGVRLKQCVGYLDEIRGLVPGEVENGSQ